MSKRFTFCPTQYFHYSNHYVPSGIKIETTLKNKTITENVEYNPQNLDHLNAKLDYYICQLPSYESFRSEILDEIKTKYKKPWWRF